MKPPLIAIAIAASVIVAILVITWSSRSGAQPRGMQISPPQSRPALQPSQSRPAGPTTARTAKVGTLAYAGPHSWRGVVQVDSDDITYEDGQITISSAGIPQGITFLGSHNLVVLRSLTFDGVGDGINIGNDQTVDDLTIDNCRFINCRSPNATVSDDTLTGNRGYGLFGSGGSNWTITNSSFQTKCKDAKSADQVDYSTQYAARLGKVRGLNISQTRFENWNGKACVWLMFVQMASFQDVQFAGGSIRIGSRPGDMGGIDKGDCRDILFRNCTFKFGAFDNWPASINIFPGSRNIRFEHCTFTTEGDWWIDIDSRDTSDISWDDQCKWNGKQVKGYLGARSSMSQSEMAQQKIGPRNN